MEYFGKILCISKEDLTRDDRADEEVSEVMAPIMSSSCFDQLVYRNKIKVVRKGIGRGVTALVSVESLPDKYREAVKAKYKDMTTDILRHWFSQNWMVDQCAQSFFATYMTPSRKPLGIAYPELVQEYTLNASALQAVIRLMNDMKMRRAAMQGKQPKWEEMIGALSFFQQEFGHTLPLSVNRFKNRVKDFQEKGYESLVSGKFGNQNKRKVSLRVERLVLGIAVLPNKPWNTHIGKMYNDFIAGNLHVYDPTTGEVFQPTEFVDSKGRPLKLSQSTINNILNNPENQALIQKALMTYTDFMHEVRPHVHRHAGEWSLSKISFDDRDLPRKLQDSKQRPKAYYAYDVTSQCVVGYAYNREKNVDLVIEMFRDMFRRIINSGWGMPAQVEVENHLMSQWRDSYLKAGEVFKFVRFCAPQNSQEKYAEPMNGAKKRSIEHKNHLGIGRFYAKNEKYRTNAKKVFDELNDTYVDKQYYTWDELIAEDKADVYEFNHSLHPNQKKYPGMTRWDVLTERMNPNLEEPNLPVIARWIGEKVPTSIRRNSYCRVNYKDLWLESPEVLRFLKPNDMKVEAYYIPDADGNMTNNVFMYQLDQYVCKLKDVGTFNTADVEQTDADKDIMAEQNHLIGKFDSMMDQKAIMSVGLMKTTAAKAIEKTEAKVVHMPIKKEQTLEELLATGCGVDYEKKGIQAM